MSNKLKNVVLCIKILLQFVLLRPFGKLIHDIAHKYSLVSVSDLRKLEKLNIQYNKANERC